MATGILRVHVIAADLHNKVGGPLHKMSPLVHIKVGHQVWNSVPCINGGKQPRWQGQWMEIATNLFQHQMHIVVKDQGHGPIGEANVPLSIFTAGGCNAREEQIHINTGGWIRLRSEFVGMGGIGVGPQVAIVQPIQPPIAVVQPMQPFGGFVIPQQGFLRLTVESAHLNVNLGGPLNKMDPFVFIRVG